MFFFYESVLEYYKKEFEFEKLLCTYVLSIYE